MQSFKIIIIIILILLFLLIYYVTQMYKTRIHVSNNKKYKTRIQVSNKKYNLTIMAIFKNEDQYMKEWLDYHLDQGFDQIFLYCNDTDISKYPYLEDLQNSKWYTQVGQRGAQIVSMIASAGAAVSPISSAQASQVETATAAGGASKQKAGDTAASPAAASPAPAALPKTPQTPGSPSGAASTPNNPPMAPSSGGAYSPASKNPNSGDKSAQYGMPNPAHTSFLDDLVAVMFNANDPAMGVSGL